MRAIFNECATCVRGHLLNTPVNPLGDRKPKEDDLTADPRWQLTERIVSTPPFQKATRLQAFLRYIVERSLHGQPEELSEYQIGRNVFERGPDYAPLEDSSVRVQARQLRLKLHEYFDGPGSQETLILEIPKGSYVPVFRSVVQQESEASQASGTPASSSEVPVSKWSWYWLPWVLTLIFAVTCGYLIWARGAERHHANEIPWPLSSVFEVQHVPRIIIADSAYQIFRTATGKPATLNEYLRSKPRTEGGVNQYDSMQARLSHSLAGGTFTSFADVVVVSAISTAAGRYGAEVDVASARDVDPRDLEQGNFIFVGSPSSNPWVALYESKLNFREGPDSAHPGTNCFVNQHPTATEAKTYAGSSSDTVREDYADLAVLPGIGNRGTVMIIQGLRHEGTEAIGRMIMDPGALQMLTTSFTASSSHPRYFEALLATRAIAGIPHVTKVVGFRIIQ